MKSFFIAHGGPAPSFTRFTPPVVGQMSPKVSAFLEANKRLLSSLTHWSQRGNSWLLIGTATLPQTSSANHPREVLLGSSRGRWLVTPDGATTTATTVATEKRCNSPCARLLGSQIIPEHFHYLRCEHLEGNEDDSSLSFMFCLFIRWWLLRTISLNRSPLKLWWDVVVLWDSSLFKHPAPALQPAVCMEA